MARAPVSDGGTKTSSTSGGRVPAGNPMAYAQSNNSKAAPTQTKNRFTPTVRTSLSDLVSNLPPAGADRDWYVSKLSPNQRAMVNKATDGGLYSVKTGSGATGSAGKGQEKIQTGPTQAQIDAYKSGAAGRALAASSATAGDTQFNREYGAMIDAYTNGPKTTPPSQAELDRGRDPQQIAMDERQRRMSGYVDPNLPPADSAGRGNWQAGQGGPPPTSGPPQPALPPTTYRPYTAPAITQQSWTAYNTGGWNPNAGLPATNAPVNYQNRDFKPVMPQGGLTQQQGQQMETLRQRQMQPLSVTRAPTPDLTAARNIGQQIIAGSGGPASPSLAAKYGQKPSAPAAPAAPAFMPSTSDWRQAKTKG